MLRFWRWPFLSSGSSVLNIISHWRVPLLGNCSKAAGGQHGHAKGTGGRSKPGHGSYHYWGEGDLAMARMCHLVIILADMLLSDVLVAEASEECICGALILYQWYWCRREGQHPVHGPQDPRGYLGQGNTGPHADSIWRYQQGRQSHRAVLIICCPSKLRIQ